MEQAFLFLFKFKNSEFHMKTFEKFLYYLSKENRNTFNLLKLKLRHGKRRQDHYLFSLCYSHAKCEILKTFACLRYLFWNRCHFFRYDKLFLSSFLTYFHIHAAHFIIPIIKPKKTSLIPIFLAIAIRLQQSELVIHARYSERDVDFLHNNFLSQ